MFNVEQIDGLPPHFHAPAAPVLDPVQRIESAERFLTALGADLRHGGNQAYYAIVPDQVRMPPFQTFRDAESYYAVLGHECVHWTRHPARLDRDLGRKRHGDEGYAREELVDLRRRLALLSPRDPARSEVMTRAAEPVIDHLVLCGWRIERPPAAGIPVVR